MRKDIGNSTSYGSERRVWLFLSVLLLILLSVVLLTPTKVVYAAPAVDIDQCENGKVGDEQDCTQANGAWVNGNLNSNNSHYGENDVVPFRNVLTDLTNGATYTYSFQWDTTKQGKHAYDYITTFNETETTADVCTGVLSAAECLVVDTIPIPKDQRVLDGPNQIPLDFDDIAQPDGVVTIYNGNLTAISGYTFSGSYAGDSSTSITVTFTYTGLTGGSAVLAWGGHIAFRGDWGPDSGASSVPGSPYHMRNVDFTCSNVPNCSAGNTDLQIQASAISLDTLIIIRKNAVPNSTTDFGFSHTGTLVPSSFTLDDDGGVNAGDDTYDASIVYVLTANALNTNQPFFEPTVPAMWDLTNITCTIENRATDTTVATATLSPPGPVTDATVLTVKVGLEDAVDCTFVNTWQGPVPVTLSFFEATPNDKGVGFSWSTSTEAGNAGFNLYVETPEGLKLVNDRLIPSAAVDSLVPQEYAYDAAGINGSVFYIEDVDINGQTRSHGPYLLGSSYGSRVTPDPIDWAAIQAEHQAKTLEREAEDRALAVGQASVAQASGQRDGNLVEGLYPIYELKVDQTGLYRVTYEQLAAAGLDLLGATSKDIALTNMGQKVPIYVSGGPNFGPGSYIEFYGQALDTLYTKTNVYQLHVDRSLASRVTLDNRRPDRSDTPAVYYLENAVVENNLNYSFGSPIDDPWYQQSMLVYTTPGTWNYTVQVDHFAGDLAPSGLTVNMWGVTNFAQNPDHHVVSAFNGQVVADDSFDGLAEYVVEAELPAGSVQEGANTLALTLPGDTGVPYDLVNLEGFTLRYPRAFVARDGSLQYSADAKKLRVTNLPTNSVVAYRLENGVLSRINYIQVKPESGAFYAEFRGSLVPAQYMVFSADALLTPAISPAAPLEDITSTPADYLIISHPDFLGGLTDLVAARQAQGLVVKVVNVETLYNQYSYGILDPQAIRDYIAYAVNNMGTEAVLLVGADNYDYHHYQFPNAISFIPTLYAATDPFIVSYAPVDPLFADVNYDNVPDVALGRFPVRTSVELAAVISKTLAYEVKDYGETAVFVADKQDGEVSFAGVSNGFINRLPSSWSTTNLFLDETSASAAKLALVDRINLGVAFVNYAGHSSSTVWSAQQVFTSGDAAALSNVGRPTVVSQWGCWNSYFVSPAANTLAHNLLVLGDRGAAAVIGSTTLTRISSETALGDLMVPLMSQPGMTIGQAFQLAKAEMAQSQIEGSLDALLGLTLLGDPMLVITPVTP